MADVQGVPVGVLHDALQHGVHQLVAVMDESGRVVFSNDGFRAIGFEPGEINGQLGLDFVHPDDVERALAGITTLFETGTSVPTQFRMRRADGGYEEFDVASTLVRHAGRTWMVVDFRPIPFHVVTAATLSALVRGEPPEVALGALADALTRIEALDCMVGFALDGARGERRTVGPLDPMMVGADAPGGPSAPWARALATGSPVVCDDIADLAQIAPSVHGAATGLGLVAATFSAVPDPASTRPALAALWYRSTTRRVFLDLYFEDFALDLARLALQGRYERRQLEHLARHDQLTGLVNRATFLTALDDVVRGRVPQRPGASAAREGVGPGGLGVIYVDLDDFKPVNDTYGHDAGDRVLEAVARRFLHLVRPGDVVARLGGDEFAVLCPGVDDQEAEEVARRLVAAAAEPVAVDGSHVQIGASAGVAVVPRAAPLTGRAVLRRADDALYRAKHAGKGTVVVSDAGVAS
jgi:diguanylate cyclase (GGDEF)-like protein/PAS domain S-box-containing protein